MHAHTAVLLGGMLLGGMLLMACQPELTPRTTVDSLRILAIQADPPEVGPGEGAIITALVVDPLGLSRTLDWTLSLCTPDDSTGSCFEYDALLEQYPDPEDAATEYAKCCARFGSEAPEEGTLELGGGLRTVVTTASAFLAESSDVEALQGANAQLNLLVCVSGVCQPPASEDGSQTDPDVSGITLPAEASALAIKRLRVTTASPETRNQNPLLRGLRLEQAGVQRVLESDEVPVLEPSQTVRLMPILDEADAECFVVYGTDGSQDLSLEAPYFSWYSTLGTFDRYFSEPEFTDDCQAASTLETRLETATVTFTLGAEEGVPGTRVTLYAVVYDRRGGMSWWIQHFEVG